MIEKTNNKSLLDTKGQSNFVFGPLVILGPSQPQSILAFHRWRLMSVKENYNFLGGEEQPRKQQLPWGSRVFPWRLLTLKKINLLGGCRPSRKHLSSAVATFPWPFGKLSMVVVSLAASLQGNHP